MSANCPGSGKRWAAEDEVHEDDRRDQQVQVDQVDEGVDGGTRGGSLFDVMEPDESAFCGRRNVGMRYV